MQPGGGGCGGAGRDDVAAAVGEEGDVEGRAGVEVLADEEVAVVEGGGGEADEEVVGSGCGGGDGGELEAVGEGEGGGVSAGVAFAGVGLYGGSLGWVRAYG